MRAGGLWGGLGRLAADRSGASAMLTILVLPVLLGFTALAIDGGMAYASKRSLQNAADSAAYSAAAAKASGYANLPTQARAVALEYGLEHGQDDVAVNVFNPAASGPYAGDARAVEVVITRPMLTFFSGLLGDAGTIRSRAVGLAGSNGAGCVLVLDPTASNAVLVNGSPVLDLNDCELQVNSSAAWAMLVNGSPNISAKAIKVVGGYFVNGTPMLHIADGISGGQPVVDDPYQEKDPPPGTCTYSSGQTYNGSTNASISNPSGTVTYCGGYTINASGNPTIKFAPGVYRFTGDLVINGTPKITGDGVTFVFDKGAKLTVNGTAELDLRAPSIGPTAGFLFFAESGSGTITLNGNNRSNLHGAMYFPTRPVIINGSNGIRGACLQLVTRTLLINGSGTFGLECGDVGLDPIGFRASVLVE